MTTDASLKAEQYKLTRAFNEGYLSEDEYNEAWDEMLKGHYGDDWQT